MQASTASNVELTPEPAPKSELFEIMRDAVQSVLKRHESLRGPYIIDDKNLHYSEFNFSK